MITLRFPPHEESKGFIYKTLARIQKSIFCGFRKGFFVYYKAVPSTVQRNWHVLEKEILCEKREKEKNITLKDELRNVSSPTSPPSFSHNQGPIRNAGISGSPILCF
jgi:hypothetical protein